MKTFKNKLYSSSVNGVNKIRPKVLLQFLEKNYTQPIEMRINIPSSEIGSLTVLESTMLVSLLKISNPKVIFEYGTFLGYSTSLFLKNSEENCKVISLDLGADLEQTENIDVTKILVNDDINDRYLKIVQSKLGPIFIKEDIKNKNERLELIYGDSTRMSVNSMKLNKKVNFIFVDGGHDYRVIKKDTENALKMIDTGIIIWHDYDSKIHKDVTTFVNNFSVDKHIFHIENTMLAFYIV